MDVNEGSQYSDKEIEEHKDRGKLSFDNMMYSVQRLDLLIISICSAGLYICLEEIKSVQLKCSCYNDLIMIKVALIILLLSILMNFLSQFFGKKANEEDYLMCLNVKKQNKEMVDYHDKNAEKYSKYVNNLNNTSMIFMFLGLLFLMFYFTVFK